jgi:hypothetical protein
MILKAATVKLVSFCRCLVLGASPARAGPMALTHGGALVDGFPPFAFSQSLVEQVRLQGASSMVLGGAASSQHIIMKCLWLFGS